MKLGIRGILAVAFIVAAIVPLAAWASWVSASALDREIAEVEDRHLLLARNLSRALDRYAHDVAAVFSHVVESDPNSGGSEHLSALLESLQFRHICLIEVDSQRVISVSTATSTSLSSISLPPLDEYIARAERALGRMMFSDATLNPNGVPAIYLTKKVGPNLLALGELSTKYLRDTQQAIAFGEGGHAAIVDSAGNVLGHPNKAWEDEVRNIAKVDAVARMMEGETGVSQFYSPAAQLDMIAGFTTVPMTGWGVMIPQPLRELEARADEVRNSAFGIVALGAGIAGIVGWLIGGVIARPMRAVAAAADRLAEGRSEVSVPISTGMAITELQGLAVRFNEMTAALDAAHRAQTLALKAAEEAAEAKSDFVARVTHELRTPLNSVIGFSGMIRDQAHGPIDPPDYVDYAKMIHDSGQRLLEMVNDIIAYARIEGRSEELNETSIDIRRIAAAVVDQVSALAEESGVAVSVAIDEGLPQVWGDEIKLRQALGHLTKNAVLFTPTGGRVRIDGALTENGGLSIAVSDTGIGIAEPDIATALAPFGQISSRLDRSHEGAGLGLPLAKMLVELHGGTLRLRSHPEDGTTVTVILPPERVGIAGTLRERLST
ncbi:ATP-binding protein [Pacificispira sp.]|uniref:ATP-binding protein n=1 Tax=Pacificispira sp. TaxID=2888761 RepID=UPI002E9C3793|nr:sensor histidine kinase [Pseudomonadota bacterium]